MSASRVKVILLVFEWIVYFCMLGMGIYFIYYGELVQKFQLQKTSFAAYEEPISNLPTIVTFIKPWNKNITFGKDFEISISFNYSKYIPDLLPTEWINLTYGENVIGGNARLHMQHFYDGLSAQEYRPNFFKITPLEFPSGKPFNFRLKYEFKNSTIMTGSQLVLSVRAENSSGTCGGIFHDGKVQKTYQHLGTLNDLVISTEKHIYLTDIRKCRSRPYMDILHEHLLANIKTKCTIPCKPDGSLLFCAGLRLSKEIDQLPVCKNDTKCFYESYFSAKEYVDTLNGPCTKVEYSIASEKSYDKRCEAENVECDINNKKTTFRVSFDPQSVQVQEEYLVSNIVAVVGAIGGTLGIFTGFSFTGFVSTSVIFFQQVAQRLKNKAGKDMDSSTMQTSTNETQTDIKLEELFARQEQDISKLNGQILDLVETVGKLNHHIAQQKQVTEDLMANREILN